MRRAGRAPGAAERRRRRATAVEDDRLRLIFTCCHPALALEAQVALTLRTLGGLETEEIARAFLVPEPTMAQRLVRAKAKIREARHPLPRPRPEELPERLDAVLAVVYLVFNEGYAASRAPRWCARDLCAEAIRLGRLLVELLPAARRATALLALMLLHDARRDARVGADGELVLLEEQDRARWDRAEIARGAGAGRGGAARRRRRRRTRCRRRSPACTRARRAPPTPTGGRSPRSTRCWPRAHPSPVVALNHAVAVAMADGPDRGAAPHRRAGRRATLCRLSPAAGGARRSAAAPRPPRRGGRGLPRGAGAGRQRGRGALPRAPPGRGGRASLGGLGPEVRRAGLKPCRSPVD